MNETFANTYLGELRSMVGNHLLMVPGFRAVLERSDGKILLQKRSDFKVWGLPGGSPEKGESIRECVTREIKEETGLVVVDFKCFGFSSNPSFEVYTYPNGHMIHSMPILIYCSQWSGRLASSTHESLALEFFDPLSLPEMLKNEFQSLQHYLAYKTSGEFQID